MGNLSTFFFHFFDEDIKDNVNICAPCNEETRCYDNIFAIVIIDLTCSIVNYAIEPNECYILYEKRKSSFSV